ncbi:MAG: HAD hydrolase-like protein [Kofleriaceae bacterium]
MARSLIFDLDGTLSDPFEGIARCYDHALAAHHYPLVPRDELAKLVGPPLDQCLRGLGVREDEIADVIATYRVRYGAAGYAENRLYDGISAMLGALGGTLGLCTSKRADFAERILDLFGLRSRFAFVSGGDIGITKAQQLAALLAAGTIDRDAIMIGDRAVDLEAAHANGLASCGVLWGFGARAELEAAQPRYLVETPAELVRVLA